MRKLIASDYYILIYFLLTIPTYLLPYLGSNSILIYLFTLLENQSQLNWPYVLLFSFIHLIFLVLLAVIAKIRENEKGKTYSFLFTLLAGIFDTVPLLSAIPFIPTVFHIVSIIRAYPTLTNSRGQVIRDITKETKETSVSRPSSENASEELNDPVDDSNMEEKIKPK